MPTALITGSSRGLGRALARSLSEQGWSVVADARNAAELRMAVGTLANVIAIPGDVTDPSHRELLAATVRTLGRLDLLVNNASHLGPSPQPQLGDYRSEELERVYAVNVFAPLTLTQLMLPLLAASNGTIINVSSDAAVEAYAGWGGYGSSKAALDQLSAVLAVEQPNLRVYAVDPGDMRTDMQQAAFPDEDISDRPEPETVVPSLLALLQQRPPSGRYRAADLTLTAA